MTFFAETDSILFLVELNVYVDSGEGPYWSASHVFSKIGPKKDINMPEDS